MIVELHILQNFSPSCLNRDDTNSPKECLFGGYRRARISSQCIKRAIREYFRDNLLIPPDLLAKRTLLLRAELIKYLIEAKKNEEEAKKVATTAIKEAMELSFKGGDKTQYLLFLGKQEVSAMAKVILDNWTTLSVDKIDDKTLKTIGKELVSQLNGGKAADLALFGRMLANLPLNNIDAACQVAHAISTHKVGVEFDFYTAVDDLQPKEETGAGMMGDIEFNSACYYRYANIDLEQLKTNLGGDKELATKTVIAFLKAAVNAIPTGKQTSFAAQNPPDFVMAVVRKSGTWSLANAFAKPIKEGSDRDLMADSITALVDYWDKLTNVYGADDIIAKPALSLKDNDLKGLKKVSSLSELLEVVNHAVATDC